MPRAGSIRTNAPNGVLSCSKIKRINKAVSKQPEVNLYAIDKRHPSAAGTYLASCVVYAALTGRSPVGNTYLANIDAQTAAFLQHVAWDTVQEYYGK
jgi:hypothetical protein